MLFLWPKTIYLYLVTEPYQVFLIHFTHEIVGLKKYFVRWIKKTAPDMHVALQIYSSTFTHLHKFFIGSKFAI